VTALADLARIVRSKNAGPTLLSLDVIFEDAADLARAEAALTSERVAGLYGVRAGQVRIVPVPAALALKIVLPRAITAGAPFDRDVYGAQQHGPLLAVRL
jgi:hypothetical protein